jgi:hypothetical protein
LIREQLDLILVKKVSQALAVLPGIFGVEMQDFPGLVKKQHRLRIRGQTKWQLPFGMELS